jgi:hypothetical protein
MKDVLDQLLRSLHLRKIAEIFDDEIKRADKDDTSYQELLARLMRAQWQANQEAALAWRIKRAGLPEQWTLESRFHFLIRRPLSFPIHPPWSRCLTRCRLSLIRFRSMGVHHLER